MGIIRVVFTKTPTSPISWLIRWALPMTRFKLALSSHCLIEYGDFMYESLPKGGVQRRLRNDALKGSVIVKTVEYEVPDAEAGMQWAIAQLGKKYDMLGAVGMIGGNRTWNDPESWFCYEFVAAVIEAAGRKEFDSLTHITETALLAIKP